MLQEGHTANEVLNDVSLALAEHAINVRHSADNVSVILVRVLDQSDPELACCRKNSITSMACTLNPGGKQHKLDMGDGSEVSVSTGTSLGAIEQMQSPPCQWFRHS